MSESMLSLQRKINNAKDLGSVVRTMKAMAATSINQYEQALIALEDYYRTLRLGMTACASYRIGADVGSTWTKNSVKPRHQRSLAVIIIGSDQGLVGQFNDNLFSFMTDTLQDSCTNASFWSIGERIRAHLSAAKFNQLRSFVLPRSIAFITSLVTDLLLEIEQQQSQGRAEQIYLFFNRPLSKTQYAPNIQKLLPLDTQWRDQLSFSQWPNKALPQLTNNPIQTIKCLIHEYLFVSLYKACTASLASENGSRLYAMQRAEKNINQLQEDLHRQYHQQRQTAIDSELFDLLGGFETLNK